MVIFIRDRRLSNAIEIVPKDEAGEPREDGNVIKINREPSQKKGKRDMEEDAVNRANSSDASGRIGPGSHFANGVGVERAEAGIISVAYKSNS